MDAAGSERAAVIALYEGGPMALLFAASAPERVTHLMTLRRLRARHLGARLRLGRRDTQERDAAMDQLRDAWGIGEAFIEGFAPSHAHDRELVDWLGRLQRLAMDPAYGRRAAHLNGAHDVRLCWARSTCRRSSCTARDDAGFDVRHARYLAEHIPGAKLVELDGVDSLPMVGDSEAVLGEIEEFLTGARRETEPDRVLATVLFTDIVRLHRARRRARRRALARPARAATTRSSARRIERHRGRAVESTGDGVLATFDGPARGIRAATGIVEDLAGSASTSAPACTPGECEVIGDDVGGLAVHIAARVMGEAGTREVLVSSTVRDLVVGSGLEFDERGERELRGIPDRWRLWAVRSR